MMAKKTRIGTKNKTETETPKPEAQNNDKKLLVALTPPLGWCNEHGVLQG